ncbi:MAG: PIG-L deacetylase family protein [Gemmataceae bacterium]
MAKTILAIGAHYDDCVFGIPGILLQAARKHDRVVILSLIGDYSNWAPTKGREKEFVSSTIAISKEYGMDMRYLDFASHRYDVTLETKRAVAAVVADVKPDLAFTMWPHDHHHDHEVASTLSKIALRHGDRVWDQGPVPTPRRIYLYDNGPRHTIGFEPNTFVDISAEWPAASEWLGRMMALTRNQPYDAKKQDGALRAKETLARYRGATCGVPYAEALWAANAYPVDVLM